MVRCVLSQLKPSELHILSFEKKPRPSASALFKAKNVEFLGLYPIHIVIFIQLKKAVNCCRNSRLVVHEYDLMWLNKLKNITM